MGLGLQPQHGQMLITTGLALTSTLADHSCVLWLYRVRAITGLRSFGPNLIIANVTKILRSFVPLLWHLS